MNRSFIVCKIITGLFVLVMVGCTGVVRVNSAGSLKNQGHDSLKNDRFFGMRIRDLSKNVPDIYEPVIVGKSPANEATIVRIANGTLKIFFVNRPGLANKIMPISSFDNGITWGDPEKEFDLPGIAYYANNLFQDENGNLHCVFHIFGKGQNGHRGRHLNLWYCRTKDHGKDWLKPKKIYDGYVGSIRGFIELKNKRLLLTVAKSVPSRFEKPTDIKVDYGWNDIVSFYSDDKGETWQTSDNSIKIAVDSDKRTRYGGIEPSIIEFKSGKIWMLIRTNKGYLYQSFSDNSGRTWQQPEATKLISSDSPATILRLSDNRILVFWCSDQTWDDPNSYANGGREVLHAAISGNEGKTWKGFREVLTSPSSKSSIRGDRGTAYPSAVETLNGKVVLVSGQGEGKSIVMFDPNWLEQSTAYDNFSKGLVQWTLFGGDSLTDLHYLPGNKNKALLIRKSGNQNNENTEAVWNFPMTKKGKLVLEIIRNPKCKGINLALTNHFSVSDDRRASMVSPVYFSLNSDSIKTGASLVKVKIKWNLQEEKASIYINNTFIAEKHFQKESPYGLNYLRVGIPGTGPDLAGYFIKSVKMVPQ